MTEVEIWQTLNDLRFLADYDNHKMLCIQEYEWELGIDVLRTLVVEYMKIMNDPTQAPKLMGYPVRVNTSNPWVINLWKRVKE